MARTNLGAAFSAADNTPGEHAEQTEQITFTVKLAPGLHSDVFAWAGRQLGESQVKVDVANAVRDLLTELVSDTEQGAALRQRVIERARDRKAQRRIARRRQR